MVFVAEGQTQALVSVEVFIQTVDRWNAGGVSQVRNRSLNLQKFCFQYSVVHSFLRESGP